MHFQSKTYSLLGICFEVISAPEITKQLEAELILRSIKKKRGPGAAFYALLGHLEGLSPKAKVQHSGNFITHHSSGRNCRSSIWDLGKRACICVGACVPDLLDELEQAIFIKVTHELRAKNRICLHASMVHIRGRSICFVGPSNSGKTCMALAMVSNGATLVANDKVFFNHASILARPFPLDIIRVNPIAYESATGCETNELVQSSERYEKVRIETRKDPILSSHIDHGKREVDMLIFPQLNPDLSEPFLERISSRETKRRLTCCRITSTLQEDSTSSPEDTWADSIQRFLKLPSYVLHTGLNWKKSAAKVLELMNHS